MPGFQLVGALKDDWWKAAQAAGKWKEAYACMQELYEFIPDTTFRQDVNTKIADHKKAVDLMKYLTKWLSEQKHTFTRIVILKLLPRLFEGFNEKAISKYQNTLFENIMTIQWPDKDKKIAPCIPEAIMALWLKVCIKTKLEEYVQG